MITDYSDLSKENKSARKILPIIKRNVREMRETTHVYLSILSKHITAIDLRSEHDCDSDTNALSVSCPDMKRKSQAVPLTEIGGSPFANDARDLKTPLSLSLSLSLSRWKKDCLERDLAVTVESDKKNRRHAVIPKKGPTGNLR